MKGADMILLCAGLEGGNIKSRETVMKSLPYGFLQSCSDARERLLHALTIALCGTAASALPFPFRRKKRMRTCHADV